MSLSLDKLCASFEECIGWPYQSPGTNDARGIDCSGMFVRAFRLQGKNIYHGSNTIWRKYLSHKGKIASPRDLERGMAVFKWKPEGDPQQDGLGNFCHIGLVTQTDPLRIVHASTSGMQVRADDTLGKWTYWGWLRDVARPSVSASAGGLTRHLRRGCRGSDVVQLQLLLREQGYDLAPDGIFGPITREAVLSFQFSRALAQDAIVGPLTWKALTEVTP